MTTLEDLKWQIHAETSAEHILLYGIIVLLSHNIIVTILGLIMIVANFFTSIKATSKLSKEYFK